MKLIETEIEHETDDEEGPPPQPAPPRPEHRRVYVSLLLTFSVLVATVVAIYAVFPKRDNELVEEAIAAHRDPGASELTAPSAAELDAWTLGVLGQVPWPDVEGDILGARSLTVLQRKVALVRYRIGGDVVSLLAARARDAPPRTHRRREGELYAVSWRRGRFTLVAVGPASSARRWSAALGAP